MLEARVNAMRHMNLDSLLASIQQEWDNLSIKNVRAAIDSWRSRLKACVHVKGGRHKQLL
jgi:hypothetical protein